MSSALHGNVVMLERGETLKITDSDDHGTTLDTTYQTATAYWEIIPRPLLHESAPNSSCRFRSLARIHWVRRLR